jgi:3-hydroxyisobutyrate dehydrogenase-like beta-hydroxyacid dehydrogenase
LGSGFIEAMRSRGDAVTVWNRTAAKAEQLKSVGATVAATPADAVRGAERVYICVSDDAAVDSLLEAIRPALAAGTLIIDHTTVSPKGTAERYARAASQGIEYLHCPVFMAPQMAREAKGIMLCSGPEARFERAEPFLEAATGKVVYLGDDPQKAAAFKLFGNAMILMVVAGLADIFAIAQNLGIEAKDAISLFSYFNPAGNIEYRGSKMAEAVFSPAMFELTMARKDARLMIESAQGGKAPLIVLPSIAARMDDLIAKGHGAEDVGVLAVDAV